MSPNITETMNAADDTSELRLPPSGSTGGSLLDGLPPGWAELLAERAAVEGVDVLGPGGLVAEFTTHLLEAALRAELTDHVGYEPHAAEGRGSGNSRNGSYPKTVHTDGGDLRLEVPRDRNGTFEPVIVPKGTTLIGGLDERIISLYASGVTTRDISKFLREQYGVDVSREFVSKVTDGVLGEMKEWQSRPLDRVWPVIFIDAIHLKVRDGTVRNKAAYLVVGIDIEGRKHVLGIWMPSDGQLSEGATFWANVLADLRNRGVEDVLITCCDGLKGLPDAIRATWPATVVQTCVVHLIRASMRYVSWKDRKAVAQTLKPIYTAPNEDAALDALAVLDDAWGTKYPALIASWNNAWDEFCPFLAFPPEVRTVIYTTNLIEGINRALRKIIKNRGAFPNDQAAKKLLYLAIRELSTTRKGVAGTGTRGWTAALNALEIHFPGRLTTI
jgi:putative transposase